MGRRKRSVILKPQAGEVTAPVGTISPKGPGRPLSLTYRNTPMLTTAHGQLIENMDFAIPIHDTSGTMIDGNYFSSLGVIHNNVTIRNCRFSHFHRDGISVYAASNCIIQDCEITQSSVPTGITGMPEFAEFINIRAQYSPNLIIRRCTLRQGSSGIYCVECDDADISFVEGYNYRGPFPRGQLVQFNTCARPSLKHFYSYCDNLSTHPEDIVNLGTSPNAVIENGLIDGCNSPSGIGVILESNTDNATVTDVDCIRMGCGSFATYATGSVFRRCRAFDNFEADISGRGAPTSGALIFHIGFLGTQWYSCTYTNPINGNISYDNDNSPTQRDITLAAGATVRAKPVSNIFPWS